MRVPNVLTRRALWARGAALLAAAAAFGPPRPALAQKVSKTVAKYQDSPKGQQRCEICLNFAPPNQCKLVEGTIDKQGWCQYFAARENAH